MHKQQKIGAGVQNSFPGAPGMRGFKLNLYGIIMIMIVKSNT